MRIDNLRTLFRGHEKAFRRLGGSVRIVVLGFVLLAVGLLKAVMSWPYVPIWYHVIFTAILLPMAIIGGKLVTTT